MVEFALRRPCPKCPFRIDVPGYLRRARAQEIARGLAEGAVFPCHQTTEYVEDADGDEDMVATDESQFCAGALILMEHAQAPNQIVRIAERLDKYNAARLDMSAPVHRSLYAFVQHHGADEPEREVCAISEEGCESPAGYLVNGLVIDAEEQGETHECPMCGEPVCDSCSREGGLCLYCFAIQEQA